MLVLSIVVAVCVAIEGLGHTQSWTRKTWVGLQDTKRGGDDIDSSFSNAYSFSPVRDNSGPFHIKKEGFFLGACAGLIRDLPEIDRTITIITLEKIKNNPIYVVPTSARDEEANPIPFL